MKNEWLCNWCAAYGTIYSSFFILHFSSFILTSSLLPYRADAEGKGVGGAGLVVVGGQRAGATGGVADTAQPGVKGEDNFGTADFGNAEIGRASCRERG